MNEPASTEVVSKVLHKALPEARLDRIPRHPEHRDVVLAIFCLGLRRRYPYTEAELNDFLLVQLDQMCACVDHVTCRRYLVDLGFVKRDRAGTRYFLNFPKVETTLAPDAIASASDLVKDALNARRRPSATPR